MSSAVERFEVGAEGVVGLAGDVALEAAEDFALVQAFGCSAVCVGAGALAVAESADRDHVQGSGGLSVAAVVESGAGGAPGAGRGRGGAAGLGEGGFGFWPGRVLGGGGWG